MEKKSLKTFWSLLMMLIVTISTCTMTSCSKDNDDEPSTLSGTTWTYSDSDGTLTISFSESTCTINNSLLSDVIRCSYNYDSDSGDCTIYYENVVMFRAEIKGNKMKLYDSSYNYIGELKKK